MQIVPYLNFNGTCEEAFKHYHAVLGGEIVEMLPHEGTPAAAHVSTDWLAKIMHARLKVGDWELMGSDAPPEYYEGVTGFSVALQIAEPDEGERVFNALAEGGEVRMPFAETFWATRFGMLVDRFGIPWMVNCGNDA